MFRMGLGVIEAGGAHHGGKDQASQGWRFLFSPETLFFLLALEERVALADGALHFEAQREVFALLLGLELNGRAQRRGGEDGDKKDIRDSGSSILLEWKRFWGGTPVKRGSKVL